MDPEIKAKVLDRPRARELEKWEIPNVSLEKVRTKYGGSNLSDEELLLRFYAGPSALLTPLAKRILNDLVGNFLVSFPGHHVDRGLAADELGERRHHDGIAQLGANLRNFVQYAFHLVFFAEDFQLVAQV